MFSIIEATTNVASEYMMFSWVNITTIIDVQNEKHGKHSNILIFVNGSSFKNVLTLKDIDHSLSNKIDINSDIINVFILI